MREKTADIKSFAGCLMVGVYRDIADEFTFLLYEEWDTNENFDAYRQSSLFQAEREKILPWLIAKPDAAHFFVHPKR
jgi:quinol monooxygenase YgiN